LPRVARANIIIRFASFAIIAHMSQSNRATVPKIASGADSHLSLP
jgi:hypothetical protein